MGSRTVSAKLVSTHRQVGDGKGRSEGQAVTIRTAGAGL